MVATRQALAPQRVIDSKTWGPGSRELGVVVHETANKSLGANAAAHARLQAGGNVRNASWNWTVDETEAVQSFANDIRTWSAGRGAEHLVAIEICVNSDGDYEQAVQNAVELVQWLRSQGVGNVLKNHHDITGKDCPTQLLAGAVGGWGGFVSRVNGTPRPPQPKPPAPSGLTVDGFEGAATVRAQQLAIGSANPDGTISSPSNFTRSLQRFLNERGFRDQQGKVLVVDGFGHRPNVPSSVITTTRTDYAYQRYLATLEPGYVPDGKWGRPSAGVKIIQRAANAGRLFK